MSAHCHNHATDTSDHNPRYRRILWIALVVNAAMFAVEIGAGFKSGSVSLLADAIDFFGDAANYAVTLAVLSMAMAWRSWAAVLKGISMLGFGLFVLGKTVWGAMHGVAPEAITMGATGLLALVANVAVAALLYAYREGDANMRSVWLCSRNDAIGNVAVMLAALGVLGTRTAWPDLAVALVMALLAIMGGWSVLRHARAELSGTPAPANGHGHDHAH
ncbi:MAG: cation transporter [Pseudomonadota bacterium]